QRTTDTKAAVVDLDTQANSRSHPTTVITPFNEGDGSVSNVEEEAIAMLPTDGPEPTISRGSGVDSNLTEDLNPRTFCSDAAGDRPCCRNPFCANASSAN
ncbi:MAG TPA: hypothetical protein V6D18_08740, partial [Thermosynechococcaceae cyanobacterium]